MTVEANSRDALIAKGADRAPPHDPQRVAKRRSIAIALLLVAMVVVFYAATIVRLGGNVMNKTW
jgi:hypothetical protein